MKIGFVGFGNMASAMADGWIAAGVSAGDMCACAGRYDALVERCEARGINTTRLSRIDIGYLAHIHLGISSQALGVLGAGILPKALLELADANYGVFHARLLLRLVLDLARCQHLLEHRG